MVTQGGGDAGGSGQPHDGDHEVAQAGHDTGPGRGAGPGAVFVEVQVTDPVEAIFGARWPRMMAASWAWLAGVTVSDVTA